MMKNLHKGYKNRMKVRTKCKKEHELSMFGVKSSRKDGISAWCRPCVNLSSLKYRSNLTPEKKLKIRAHGRAYKKSEKGKIKWRDSSYRKKYGISISQVESMIASQDGKCAICKTKPEGVLFVDHRHSDGKVRGMLCFKCNTALGGFGDSISRLSSAIKYLEEHES